MSGPEASRENGMSHHRDDEIDLAELFTKIWNRKLWVLLTTVVAVALALIFLFFAKPVYQAKVHLMPPKAADLQSLNVSERRLEPSVVYDQVLNELGSKQQRRIFFDQEKQGGLFSNSKAGKGIDFQQFDRALKIQKPRKGSIVFTSISLDSFDKQSVAPMLNAFVTYVQEKVVSDQISNLLRTQDQQIELLEQQIASKRSLAKRRRQDRIAQLREAYEVADAIGMTAPGTAGFNLKSTINIVDHSSLFMRGTTVLSAEIMQLENRKSDDPFIEGLRDLQEQVAALKAISIDSQSIHPVQIDAQAFEPEKPIKPKKRLIVAISIVLGGVLGLILALVVPARKEA
ncbi:hypothetical protein DV711_08210 [Motiliproteus coralliicola]|uniref:Polysaccharide chain length determinant N-terminal domain-containing protein n=1 Tax=Motiliproteus coralliicola TaxID=2283196 RepID=A0A369WSV3_9GAMM|nr:Wzz/FepE/Etk N-terminal domain-containing protein [Motiliproteus coralliicola]RDE22565.1 hypothetical protein DV711_08210 [Motiliproteus coralliicola]